jgi:hypothetical protein
MELIDKLTQFNVNGVSSTQRHGTKAVDVNTANAIHQVAIDSEGLKINTVGVTNVFKANRERQAIRKAVLG